MTGYNSGLAGLGIAQRFFPEEYTKTAVLLYATMTADAVFVEYRFDFSAKVHFLFDSQAPKNMVVPANKLRKAAILIVEK